MRVLLINYHYFINGGPDNYFFNIKKMLEDNGHIVIPFSFNYSETIENEYIKYFPIPITGIGPCMLSKQKNTLFEKVNGAIKLFHNKELLEKFENIIKEKKPDIIYSIYLSSTILPEIFKLAKNKYNLPVAYRLSDFHLYCASYLFCKDGKVCTKCLENITYAIINKCVKNSYLMSFMRVMQMQYLRIINDYRYVDLYVSPTQFMRRVLIDNGIDKDKVVHIPTFCDEKNNDNKEAFNQECSILYLGNVTKEKGVEVLINAFIGMDIDLVLEIVGKYEDSYLTYIKQLIPIEKINMVRVRGFAIGEELVKIKKSAKVLVHPALWYENMPNSVIELMSMGVPIIASDIGSMPEMIDDGYNGYLFSPGNVFELREKLYKVLEENNNKILGENAKNKYIENYTAYKHYYALNEVFKNLYNK